MNGHLHDSFLAEAIWMVMKLHLQTKARVPIPGWHQQGCPLWFITGARGKAEPQFRVWGVQLLFPVHMRWSFVSFHIFCIPLFLDFIVCFFFPFNASLFEAFSLAIFFGSVSCLRSWCFIVFGGSSSLGSWINTSVRTTGKISLSQQNRHS